MSEKEVFELISTCSAANYFHVDEKSYLYQNAKNVSEFIAKHIQLQSAKIAELEAENEKLNKELEDAIRQVKFQITEHAKTLVSLNRIREGVKGLKVYLRENGSYTTGFFLKQDIDNLMGEK